METASSSGAPLPGVSRVLDDGTLVELIHDPALGRTAFAVATPGRPPRVEPYVELPGGGRLIPYSANNNLISSGCILLPSDIGDFRDKGDLVVEIQLFLRRYVDLSPLFEEIAPYYVLLSWVYDAFRELPYLRFRGDYGTGKTRALLTVGSLCYKPFFASGASTVSPIFHILDAFRGTLVLDEADFRFSDSTAELTKVLNNGTVDGLPVLRTMSNRNRELNPQAFRVYGPKLIAMRRSFADPALESRFLTEETGGRPLRPNIPIHTPNSLGEEARTLRNKLLSWRFAARALVHPDPDRLMAGAEPRLNQTALALLSLVDDAATRERIAAALLGDFEGVRAERSDGLDAVMLTALLNAFAETLGASVPIGEIANRFNARAEADLGQVMTNKWVGTFLRNRLHLRTVKTSGVYAVPRTEAVRVEALATRSGVMQ